MNKETYEALKRIIYTINDVYDIKPNQKDIKQVEDWIDEVAKEYESDKWNECLKCGKELPARKDRYCYDCRGILEFIRR